MENFLQALRAANIARDKEWCGDVKLSATFKVNELAGEAGEACNILKKLDRERFGLRGCRAALPALQEEFADVVICCDLLAMHFSIVIDDSAWVSHQAQNSVDRSLAGARLALRVGGLCGVVICNGSTPNVAMAVDDVIVHVKRTADWLGIDLERAIVTKFNMTSEKHGLTTKLVR